MNARIAKVAPMKSMITVIRIRLPEDKDCEDGQADDGKPDAEDFYCNVNCRTDNFVPNLAKLFHFSISLKIL